MNKCYYLLILCFIFSSCKETKGIKEDTIVQGNPLVTEMCACISKNSENIEKKRYLRKVRKDCIKKTIYNNSTELKKQFNGKSVEFNYKYYESIFTDKVDQNCPKTLH